MTEPLLKARDVAELLGLDVKTVVEHFQHGDLPGFRLYGRKGGPLRFRASEIDAWLEESCRPTTLQGHIKEGRRQQKASRPVALEVSPVTERILRPVRD